MAGNGQQPIGVTSGGSLVYGADHGCVGKQRFVSATEAAKAASHFTKGRPNVYRCDSCNGYHVGSTLARGRDKKRKVRP